MHGAIAVEGLGSCIKCQLRYTVLMGESQTIQRETQQDNTAVAITCLENLKNHSVISSSRRGIAAKCNPTHTTLPVLTPSTATRL